jgi:hypothetical protein
MDTIYSPDAQKALDDLFGSLQEALSSAKESAELVDRLRGDLARKDRIILEKVASAKTVDPTLVASLVADLVDHGLAKEADARILTEQLTTDPNNAVKLAARLAVISMPAPSPGKGIAKEASVTKHSDPAQDGWRNVIQNGA